MNFILDRGIAFEVKNRWCFTALIYQCCLEHAGYYAIHEKPIFLDVKAFLDVYLGGIVSRIDDYFKFHETALSVRGQRQQLLASNIANADTPNYKARDIDFSSALNQALNPSAQTAAGELNKTANAHLNALPNANAVPPFYRENGQGNIDGNTVDLDVERNQFADNSLRYEASLTIINLQIRGLLAALQGQ